MRDSDLGLDQRLFEHPYEFDFFQAVRLLHLLLADRGGVGNIEPPDEEPVRFKTRQSLAFQASSIYSLSADEDPPRMTIAFMGLTGIQGVLPHHYTEHILERAQARDFAMAEFFDLFNHRIVSLFYRAWEKHQMPIRYQLAAAKGQTDAFTQYLFDWIGMGTSNLRGRLAVKDEGLLRYSGLLGQRPASAISLAAIVRDHFGVSVEIQEFVGSWYWLSDEDQSDLTGQRSNNQLGEGALAGDAVWDPQARFRVRLGPLSLVDFLSFLPDGQAIEELRDLLRFYVGPVLQFEIQLILRASEVPWSRLGDETPAGPRLGWFGWVKTGEFSEDAADAVFAM